MEHEAEMPRLLYCSCAFWLCEKYRLVVRVNPLLDSTSSVDVMATSLVCYRKPLLQNTDCISLTQGTKIYPSIGFEKFFTDIF